MTRAIQRGLFSLLFMLTATAAANAEPFVVGYRRFAEDESRQRQAGQILLRELGCVHCHRDVAEAVLAKPAPKLSDVSTRVTPSFLRRYLSGPQSEKHTSTMPDVLAHFSKQEKAEAVECLVHYLESLGAAPTQDLPPIGSKRRGEHLYHEVGCVACHGARNGEPVQRDEIPLGDVAKKYTLWGLGSFLRDPHSVRSGGRMPNLRLTSPEANQIAAYLLGLPEVSRLTYYYYEGSWQELPDFSKLEAKSSGTVDKIDVAPRERNEQFGLRFEALLLVQRAGEYKFHLGSDDGSRLSLDDKPLIENSGVHPYTVRSAGIRLEPGKYHVVVDYFEQGGEERLTVEVEGPDLPRGDLTRILTANDPDVAPPPLEVVKPIPALVARGRELFRNVGCAACHEAVESGHLIANNRDAPTLNTIIGKKGGCIGSPVGKQPRYFLNKPQKNALAEAIAVSAAQVRLLPESVIETTLASFNCYACHQRGKIGGIVPEANPHFKTTIPEMGDEGRIPPHLSGIGDKLRVEYLRKILSTGVNDRPYMLTRMPRFDVEAVRRLPDIFSAVDHRETAVAVEFSETSLEVKSAGREIIGDKGFSCIKCHSFGRYKATGIQSIDMQAMAARLNGDWFRRYVANPPMYRRGTRMPSAWPLIGNSLLDHFDANNDRQIAAVWEYLLDGNRARLPSGLVIAAMELVPIDEAIIYRNFIQGSGTRAIAVGYPEGVHQSFDPNDLRLALLWSGQFMDASRHWAGRGEGFQPPAGEKILTFSDGPAWAQLESADATWPTESARELGQRFLGYRVTPDQRPSFRYQVGEAMVLDSLDVRGLGGGEPIPRRFIVKNKGPAVWYRAASGNIVSEDEGWWRVDDQWRVRIVDTTGKSIAQLREASGRKLLVVEVPTGKTVFNQYYQW
jgi:mono/diheme cytochrome c family protein